MMSAGGFREVGQSTQASQGATQNVPFTTSIPATNAHGEPMYYQMSRMTPAAAAAAAAAAGAAGSAASSSSTGNVTFNTSTGGSAITQAAATFPFFSTPVTASTTHYTKEPQERTISDEMMRHILLSANSLPATTNQSPFANIHHHTTSSQMMARNPLQPTTSFLANGAMPGVAAAPAVPPSFELWAAQMEKPREVLDMMTKVVAGGKAPKVKGKRAQGLAPGQKPIRKKKRRAFEFYWEELRSEYAKSHSHLGHNERRAIAQAQWKNVTDRDKWQKMADDYNEKMLDEKYKHRPKPPVTANAFFFKEQHVLLRQQRPELKGGAVLAEISKMWERCSDRTRWIEMQAHDRRRYEAEMAAYKANQVLSSTVAHITS